MTPKLFFAQIEFWFLMHYALSVFHTQTGLPKDCPGPFHKIMTVSNEKFDYILNHLAWQNCKNIAVTSQNNLKERIFDCDSAVIIGFLKFSFSERATKILRNFPHGFDVRKWKYLHFM